MKTDLTVLEKNIGYTFKNRDHLVTALTHTSYANERSINKPESYERSEFLGDAILEYISSEYLYNLYPDKLEGDLTKIRASLVCEMSLSKIATEMELGEYAFFSKGERLTGGPKRNSILCDLFESVLGAIYLDGGMEPCKEYVQKHLLNDIEGHTYFKDAKSKLQEISQRDGWELSYVLVSETGPDHNKTFTTSCMKNGVGISIGVGQSKKASEQMAAYNAIMNLKEKQD